MSATSLQTLLRFLSQDAKLSLATAISKVHALQQANLASIETLAKAKPDQLKPIFEDDKLAKQVLNAAKRVAKKRAASGGDDDDDEPSSPKKKRKDGGGGSIFSLKEEQTPAELEADLLLPGCEAGVEELDGVVVFTNRAPLVLAFIVVLIQFTMPQQPLSSRLSLAQAYVSVTSRARAVNLGIESGQSAEELGVGLGQATVTVMGKELRVLKRWGYDWKVSEDASTVPESSKHDDVKIEDCRQDEVKVEEDSQQASHQQPIEEEEALPTLWGLDLEALKKQTANTHMPIHTPQSARAYLLKSFDSPPASTTQQLDNNKTKKPSAKAKVAEKERNLGLLLRAIELLYQSWVGTIGPAELDKRVWGWYIRVRPAVEQGVAGWGGKNEVRLADILALRREG